MNRPLLLTGLIIGLVMATVGGGIFALIFFLNGGFDSIRAAREVRARGRVADQPADLDGTLRMKVPRGFSGSNMVVTTDESRPPRARFTLTLGLYATISGQTRSGTLTVQAMPRDRGAALADLFPPPGRESEGLGAWERVAQLGQTAFLYRRKKGQFESPNFAAYDTARGFSVELWVDDELYTEAEQRAIVTDALASVTELQPGYDAMMAKMRAETDRLDEWKKRNLAAIEKGLGRVPATLDQATVTPNGDIVARYDDRDRLYVAVRLAQVPTTNPETDGAKLRADPARRKELTTEREFDENGNRVGWGQVVLGLYRGPNDALKGYEYENEYVANDASPASWKPAFRDALLKGTPSGNLVFWRYRIVSLGENPENIAAWISDGERIRTAARDGAPIWKMNTPGK